MLNPWFISQIFILRFHSKIDTIEEQGRDNKTSRRSYNEMPNEKGQTDKQ
jgi:hypothetical protein